MADGEKPPSENFRRKQSCLSDTEESDNEEPSALDLGAGHGKRRDKTTNHFSSGASGSSASEWPKKEENPFSFKHFLKNDRHYQNQGARPKVYCEGRPISSISDLDLHQPAETMQTRIVPEFSSALPDFVQDHLVMEQSYLSKEQRGNLPDFTPSRNSVNINRLDVETSRTLNQRTDSGCNVQIPLDLPVRPQAGFPLDLPIVDSRPGGSRSCPPSADVGVSKSLPDFLADGAVRSQSSEGASAGQSPEWELDRLRQELEMTRRQLSEQMRRADNLQRDLETTRKNDHEYTQNLVKTVEQLENNLERCNRRAASADSTILKLRQEIKSLKSQISQLKKENSALRAEEGAAGGANFVPTSEVHSQRLAQELRAAASTAEHSLRQLLTGVDNLRIMAATLENIHRIEERTEPFLDLDDEAGPAL